MPQAEAARQARLHVRRGCTSGEVARQAVQVDTVHFGSVFAFTAVDIFSREADVLLRSAADVLLRSSVTADDEVVFLRACMERRFDGHVELLQSDGGSQFKGEFALRALLFCDCHRIARPYHCAALPLRGLTIARPYKKNEQAHLESFNRTLRKECLGWGHYKPVQMPLLQERVEACLRRYHYHHTIITAPLSPTASGFRADETTITN